MASCWRTQPPAVEPRATVPTCGSTNLARGTPTQLTFAGEVLDEIAWARDSKHLVYQDGKSLWWTRSDGAGQTQLLLDGKELGPTPLGPRPFSFGPSRLAFAPTPGGLPDVWTLPVDVTDPERPKPGKPEAFLKEGFVEVDPSFSPDGKFVAYKSTESGEPGVFVRPFPGPGGKWRVTDRGDFPAWSPATQEISLPRRRRPRHGGDVMPSKVIRSAPECRASGHPRPCVALACG